jgi:pilus assembly protein Flp/PilA
MHRPFLTGASMKNFIQQFLRDEDGITAIEYGLLAGLIGVAIIGGATLLGHDLSDAFTSIAGEVSSAAS